MVRTFEDGDASGSRQKSRGGSGSQSSEAESRGKESREGVSVTEASAAGYTEQEEEVRVRDWTRAPAEEVSPSGGIGTRASVEKVNRLALLSSLVSMLSDADAHGVVWEL